MFELECVSKAFSDYVATHTNEVYKICSLPWTMSAIGMNDYNSTYHPPACTLNNAIKQNDATISFFFEASDYNVTGCKGKTKLFCLFWINQKLNSNQIE